MDGKMDTVTGGEERRERRTLQVIFGRADTSLCSKFVFRSLIDHTFIHPLRPPSLYSSSSPSSTLTGPSSPHRSTLHTFFSSPSSSFLLSFTFFELLALSIHSTNFHFLTSLRFFFTFQLPYTLKQTWPRHLVQPLPPWRSHNPYQDNSIHQHKPVLTL